MRWYRRIKGQDLFYIKHEPITNLHLQRYL